MRYEKHSRPKAAYWSKYVDQWKKSGLLQKDYCAKHGLGLGLKSFGRWKRILSQSGRGFAATKSAVQIPQTVLSDFASSINHSRNARIIGRSSECDGQTI